MDDSSWLRPEGELLRHARRRRESPISTRQAAEATPRVSPGWWQQIEKGYRSAGRGQRVEVVAPAETLARMARAVGVTPDELVKADRSDAADALRDMQPAPAVAGDTDEVWERLAALDVSSEDRDTIARMLTDPDWVEAGRTAIEYGERLGVDALRDTLRDVREEMGELRRQREHGINRITRLLSVALGR